jgi:ATP-dependent DNA ligase
LHQFLGIVRVCRRFQPDTLIDGEIVAVDDELRLSFQPAPASPITASAIQFYAFDLLSTRGKSLLQVPFDGSYSTTLRATFQLLSDCSESIEAAPADLIHAAKALGFEGIVAKGKDSIDSQEAQPRLGQVQDKSRSGVLSSAAICRQNLLRR